MGSVSAGSVPGLIGDASQKIPYCVARAGFHTFAPALLTSWTVGTAVWSDRAWTYTHLGSFTTSAFQFKVQTSVDSRKAAYTLTAPCANSVDIYVLGETRRVDAPWAFSAGEPQLDKTWGETCETLPQYEAGATYQLDFCRRKTLDAGESVSFDALAGGKIDVFIKMVVSQGRTTWRKTATDLCSDDTSEDVQSRPLLRTAPEGRRSNLSGSCHRGISPPPLEGWLSSESGWDTHPGSPKWLRKVAENEAIIFWYAPDKTHWVTMPSRGFVNVDMCLDAVAFLRDTPSLQIQCFLGWKDQVRTVRAWRQKIQIMAAVDGGDGAVSSDVQEEQEVITDNFPKLTAFIAPPALRSKSKPRPSQRPSVTFAQDV